MKYFKIMVRIVQGILWVGAMVMGIGNMPSGFGACFLILAVLLTPQKVMDWLWESWQARAVLIAGLLYYMGQCIPMEDVDRAAENFIRFLQHLGRMFG